jgi:hypothetical protein
MTSLGQRALEYFIAPELSATVMIRAAAPPAAAAVLGAPGDVSPVATLLAAQLRVRLKTACVLLGGYCAGDPPSEPTGGASRGARRVAARLEGRDLAVRAHGRSVRVRLPSEPEEAGLAWRRALAAAQCPSVLTVAGPRPAGLDPLLAELGLIVVVAPPAACHELVQLAADGLAPSGADVVAGRSVPGPLARLSTASSIATSKLLGPDVVRAVRRLA